ncbi:MAG: immunoglobulin-like domain-containing protein [Gammaproteobacteria bacterium]
MTNHNEEYISPYWPGFRRLWWIVAILLFLFLLITWFMGYGPGGKACPVPVEVRTEVKTIEKLITVPDTIAPLITLNNDSVLHLTTGQQYVEPGARAVDGVDGNVTVTTDGTVDTTRAGEYIVTYNVTDAAGNTSSETRKVIVSDPDDTAAPLITLGGSSTVYLKTGEEYVEAGASATDALDGDISVKTEGMVDTGTAGEYAVNYSATDSAGNTSTAMRKVVVVDPDKDAPIISLNDASVLYLKSGDTYVEHGAKAVDANDGNLQVTTEGNVDTNRAGEYHISYSVTDSAGNTATKMRRVVVEAADATAPVITLHDGPVIYLDRGEHYKDAGAKAHDATDGKLTVTTQGAVNTASVGSHVIIYSATDSAGNTSTATRRVIVSEPVQYIPTPIKVVAKSEPISTFVPAARLYFGVDKASNPDDSNNSLDSVVAYLKKNEKAIAFVSGFHDPSGNALYNKDLANRRAKTAVKMLKAAGISNDRIFAEKPVETTGTGEPAEARRVEINIGY